ncbi:uncharacterized protein GIQ15_01076 [Arthroderma uncinatum]|uniref:uncharacterized protein n=1 Tax=Arthroderma uncinatum TaxID=74035 RepID=UPI00144A9AE1|nr:uncharacterized protein GIQ15_01076 [Arthroderma uncinatum]KAF3491559.1 hypothetical protein GIQ15_01076 [Arthroderma uncinatum]
MDSQGSQDRQEKDEAYTTVEREYLGQRERRGQRQGSAMRRKDRDKERTSILSMEKINDLPTLRSAYADLFLSIRRSTSRDGQRSFVRGIESAYGVKRDGKVTRYPCILDGGWYFRAYYAATHIFPPSYGQKAMTHIFGKEANGEINSARNGLFLPRVFKRAFDTYRVAIVPLNIQSRKEPREWKIVLLDYSLKDFPESKGTTFGDLHNKQLIFATDARPRARYFYFHFLLAMVTSHRALKSTGVIKSELPDMIMLELTRAWGKDGRYLTDNIVRGFIETAGNELPGELRKNISSQGFMPSEPEDEVSDICEAVRAMDLRSDDEDEEDEAYMGEGEESDCTDDEDDGG